MTKLRPEERNQKLLMERYIALQQSKELKKLRRQGLAILHREKMFTEREWGDLYQERTTSPEYIAWCNNECKKLGEVFGLASWVVAMACLVRGYRPETGKLYIGSDWPRIEVVTEVTEHKFLKKLTYEANNLNLRVVLKQGPEETCLILPAKNKRIPVLTKKPPIHTSFTIRVAIPVGYPPEAARNFQRQAGRMQRELLIRLGYVIPKRIRTSSLTAQASILKVNKSSLPRRGIYDIVDKI
ncbi:MAG: hypothetical protein NTX46_01095, partial [Chloroflexi bacterium]|nr:hypothetical protein [Chloroflexota bacterium]